MTHRGPFQPLLFCDSVIRDKKEILHYEAGETLAEVAQRSCGCPLPGSDQGQVGWGFKQPGPVEGVPAHGRGVGTRWSIRSLPNHSFYAKGDTNIHPLHKNTKHKGVLFPPLTGKECSLLVAVHITVKLQQIPHFNGTTSGIILKLWLRLLLVMENITPNLKNVYKE